jgi:hypothetical protein
MHLFLTRALIVSPLLLCLVSGCGRGDGPELVRVSGTVTIDGKAAPKLELRFIPEASGGSPSYGVTDANGHYTLMFNADRNGAMIGKHMVEISAIPSELGEDGNPLPNQNVLDVPSRYSEPGTLTAEVKDDNSPIDFHLESK